MRRCFAALWVAALASLVLLTACGDGATALRLRFCEDIGDGGVDSLRVRVTGASSGQMLDATLALPGPGAQSYVIEPGSDPNEDVDIVVEGLVRGVVRAMRTVSGSFDSGSVVDVDVCFASADAGMDAMVDGSLDTGTDGGPDGGACDDASDCRDGFDCTVDDCVAGACEHVADDTGCVMDEVCDVALGCSCPTCTRGTEVAAPGGVFDVILGPDQGAGSCGGGGGSEGSLRFTLDRPMHAFWTTQGAGVDTVVYLLSCPCSAGSEISCQDDTGGVGSADSQLLGAGSYVLVVDSKDAMSATVATHLYFSEPGSGPEDGEGCGEPQPLIAMVTTTTCGYRDDTSEPCGATDLRGGPDRVYRIEVDAASTVTIDGCAMCRDNLRLELRSVCNDPATRIDDATNGLQCTTLDCAACEAGGPFLEATLEPGVYYVWVDDADAACGAYRLRPAGL